MPDDKDKKLKSHVIVDLDGSDPDLVFHYGSLNDAKTAVEGSIEQGYVLVDRSKDDSPHYSVYYPVYRVRSFTISEKE